VPGVFLDGTAVRYPAGYVLFRQGDRVETLYLIVSGAVRLGRSEGDGEHVVTRFLGRGAVAGLVAAVADPARAEHDVTGECAIACEGRAIKRSRLERALHGDAGLALWIARRLALEHRQRNHIKSLQGHRDPVTRFGLLLEVCPGARRVPQPDGSIRVILPLLHQDIAALLDVTRQHLTRQLRHWEAKGLIRRDARGIVIPGTSPVAAAATRVRDPE
jgi:CRP/FNR family transcriptional regulator